MATTINDGVMTKLEAFDGDASAKQIAWLKSVISPAPADGLTLADYWGLYMTQLGYTTGAVQEKMARYMQTVVLPFTTQDPLYGYNDVQLAYWCGTGLDPDYETIFADYNIGDWVVTRASGATTYPSDGDYPIGYVGNDEPTFFGAGAFVQFVPSTNFLGGTDDIGGTAGSWSVIGGTLVPDAELALDGTMNGNRLVASEVAESHYLRNDLPSMENEVVIFMCARAYSAQFPRLEVTVSGASAVFDIANGTVVSESDAGIASILRTGVDHLTPWAIFTLAKPASPGDYYALFVLQDSEGNEEVAGDGSSGMTFWGGTFEVQPSATGYIANTGAPPATRAEQRTTLDTSLLSGFNGDNYAFQFVLGTALSVRSMVEPTAGPQTLFSAQTGPDDWISLHFDPTFSPILVYIRAIGGVATGLVAPISVDIGEDINIFIAQNTSVGMTFTVDGVSYSDTSANARASWTAAVPSVVELFNGQGALNYPGSGLIRVFRYWSPDLW